MVSHVLSACFVIVYPIQACFGYVLVYLIRIKVKRNDLFAVDLLNLLVRISFCLKVAKFNINSDICSCQQRRFIPEFMRIYENLEEIDDMLKPQVRYFSVHQTCSKLNTNKHHLIAHKRIGNEYKNQFRNSVLRFYHNRNFFTALLIKNENKPQQFLLSPNQFM